MTKLPELTIEFDRIKLSKLVLIGLVFILAGGVFVSEGLEAISEGQGILKFILLIGLATLTFLFSIPNTIIWLKKLLGRKEGLLISAKGFTDRSGSYDYGLVSWSDVKSISTFNVAGQDSISISVLNKDKYRDMGGVFNKLIFDFNVKYSGTPIHITSKSLKIDNQELANKLSEYFEASKI